MKEIVGLLPDIPGLTLRLFQTPIKSIRGSNAPLFVETYFKDSSFILLEQTHGNDVVVVPQVPVGITQYPRVDASYTTEEKTTLAVLSGDCMAILFYDSRSRSIAACHAGYLGVLSGIVDTVISDYFSNSTQYLHVIVSPFIGNCCYNIVESKDGRIEKFEKKYSPRVFRKENNNIYLDLQEALVLDLVSHGVLMEKIHFSNECTSCSHLSLPSHYRSTYLEGKKRTHTLITTIEINARSSTQ